MMEKKKKSSTSSTNCTVNGVNYFRISYDLPRGPKGERKRIQFYGTGKKDAESKRDAYIETLKSGLNVDFAKQKLGVAMKSWLFEVKSMDSELKATSFERYDGIFRHTIEGSDLASMTIPAIKSIDVQRHLNNLYKGEYSYSATKSSLKLIKMFFIYATENDYTTKNPCAKSIVIPGSKSTKIELETFNTLEIATIKAALTHHRLKFLILLALGTGLRKGELLALKYEDIKNGRVHVNKTMACPTVIDADGNRKRTTEIWEPKTLGSNRFVPFPEELVKELGAHSVRQITERLKNGIGGKSEYIFTTESGKLYDPTNVYVAYSRLLKKAGIAHRKFHALRHTYASELIRSGVPVPEVQRLMGHSDIATTMIYVHPKMEDLEKSVQVLNRWFKD